MAGPETWLGEFGRLRYQFIGAFIFAVLLPVFLRWGLDLNGWLLAQQINTIVASSFAILAALMVLRQLSSLPGVRQTYYLVPVLLISFLVVLAVLLFARIEYNRYLFPSSLVLSVIWIFFAQSVARQYRPPHFAVVPGGAVERLSAIERVLWTDLHEPALPNIPISGVVADLREDLAAPWERFITQCALSGIRVFHVKQLQESLTGRVEIAHLSENTLGSLNPDANYLKVKQAADWLLAFVLLTVSFPILVGIGIAIRLDSKGPALFRQTRIGFRGRPFEVVKFRTMRENARADDTLESAITRDADPRITRLGKFLRRTRLDELPQVVNVLKGEMSWIGPRPEAVPLSQWYEQELPFYRYRHIVRPGISGWAQVNQGHVTAVDQTLEKLHYDFYYIKNFSPWLDILILMRTVRTVLTGHGSR
ncbi:MAG: glycosyl transferase involved in lipopolysaccharide synthesis [Devosia sp.]|nr:glycosyl transferase involved in lipopolysaccharide synthesis [Devosia sp.]